MAKIWSTDNPKAALMERKRAALVGAATEAFLNTGYAEASVNQIAATAGVSIKTLYRHFESKDDLFSAVMQAACGKNTHPGSPDKESGEEAHSWYSLPPSLAIPQAGEIYLRHALSDHQLALFRVVTRDAHRFPELGRRYQNEVIGNRDAQFAGYLDIWAEREGWTVHDKTLAAQVFAGMLKAGIFEDALFGLRFPSEEEITERAIVASREILLLLKAAQF